jgi:hypothetical protein
MSALRGAADPPTSPARTPLLTRWRVAFATGNAPAGSTDAVTRWLVLSRASVLPMTITAALVAGLLAWWTTDSADVWLWPLWFAAHAFVHTRITGAFLVLGMFVGVLVDV